MRVKKSVREAKLALANAAEVAEQCEADCSLQSAVDDQILAEVKQWCGDGGDIERRKASNSLLVKFLGDESADTWSKVHCESSSGSLHSSLASQLTIFSGHEQGERRP